MFNQSEKLPRNLQCDLRFTSDQGILYLQVHNINNASTSTKQDGKVRIIGSTSELITSAMVDLPLLLTCS